MKQNMIESTVRISMQDDNDLNCSYAVIRKGRIEIILILRDSECAIFNFEQLKAAGAACRYLLLKHYSSPSLAYTDFLKLIGKMCKKHEDSKYFLNPRDEDNRMVCDAIGQEHIILDTEKALYAERFQDFMQFIEQNCALF